MLNYDKLKLWSKVEKSKLLKYLSGGVTCHGTPSAYDLFGIKSLN